MRKTLIIILLVGLMVVGTYQAVFAFGFGEGNGIKARICNGDCWYETVPSKLREKITGIREAYFEKITALKEKLRKLREDGDFEGMMQAREEMSELKEEMRAEILPLIPEGYRERLAERGAGRGYGPGGKMMTRGFRTFRSDGS